ncbi:ExeM/NucH family extracellular endonuclease [Galbitalea sp. SE-J8]|uniref:ExeM/NucH family extracellular endonuclease n=1 Tax=Galbitalea sp. SE-J8 TaxID=3054952 RepID=UPI00259CA230|nr:ExeM/NucH family extracellular endonuclease [Galbitalea sp. SE-J8]MDM4761561.1 ExeM/NucH family extracellular endonuclease [Galbitalea sp. SE-J8]
MHRPPAPSWKAGVAALAAAALVLSPVAAAPALANTAGTGLVISEVYGAGGNAGAVLDQDYVELYNPTSAAIDVSGFSVQYRSATGTANPSGVVPLAGSVPASGHYLVALAAGATGGAIPAGDATNASVNISGTSGTVFLAAQSTALSSPPTGSLLSNPAIIDLVGFGGSNTYETALAAPGSPTTSIARSAAGADTDSNAADFTAGAPTPENSGVVPPPAACDPDLPIAGIQGTGAASPCVGLSVTTRGIVTAAYPTGGFGGYYLQTPGTGGDLDLAAHTASDGLFVYSPSTVGGVAVGSYVQVTGTVSEFGGLTELSVSSGAGLTVLTDAVPAVRPVTTALPTGDAARERLEGMLVAPSGDYTVTDDYDLNAYGSIGVVAGSAPLLTPTVAAEPGPAAVGYAADNAAKLLTLDDGASINFLGADANKDIPLPYLSPASTVRIGSGVTFTGPVVLDYRNSLWNLQPTRQLTAANAADVQPASITSVRPASPADVGGDVTIATFNVLNYFPTTGDSQVGCTYYDDRDGNHITVKDGCAVRGAADAANLARQQAKIVTAINGLGADVVSLEEIENSVRVGKARDFALATLVDALNAAAGAPVWAFVPSPLATPTGQDVIRTAFIYRPATLEPVGSSVILDDPAFANARQPLAQAFRRVGGAPTDAFLAIVNHLKSKGSGDGADADQGDGQGASNASRVAQAKALVAFADRLKATTGLPRVFLTGDFNSYLREDPVDVIEAAGYVDLGSTRTAKQTYAFDGAVGSLDHVFASTAAAADVAAVDVWNINAYESVAFEYSRYNYNATDFYAPDPYRSSDHDPFLVGVNLRSTITAATPRIGGDAKVGAKLTVRPGTWTPAPVRLAYRWLRDGRPIAKATHPTYRATRADIGHRISVRVTGSKRGYASVERVSAALKVYRALTATPKPRIVGTATVGHPLTVRAGRWKPAKVTLHYRWYRNGTAIARATKKTYRLTRADRGDRITVRVTGSRTGYFTESRTRSIARIR